MSEERSSPGSLMLLLVLVLILGYFASHSGSPQKAFLPGVTNPPTPVVVAPAPAPVLESKEKAVENTPPTEEKPAETNSEGQWQ